MSWTAQRSLTNSIYRALETFWTSVEDSHRNADAAVTPIITSPDIPTADAGGNLTAASYDTTINAAQNLLELLAQTHGAHWELPIRLLARRTVATLHGLTIDYLHNHDSDGSRQVLQIFSFQLAQFGRRPHKTKPS